MSLNPLKEDSNIKNDEPEELDENSEILEEKNSYDVYSKEEQKFLLELGDVIKITNATDDELNDKTFIIDYIDNTKLKIINTDDMKSVKVIKIDENGQLGNGNITGISLISRSNEPGYARQNNLVSGNWINIYFGGEVPSVITAEITNLEEDMIELKTFPDCETLYINFDYKGIPEDLPIETIELREKPEGENKCVEDEIIQQESLGQESQIEEEQEQQQEQQQQEQQEILQTQDNMLDFEEEMGESFAAVPSVDIKNQMRQLYLKADDIKFGDEELGPIKQIVDIGEEKQRYSIQVQTNDLLDDMLSTIPQIDRTNSALNSIHQMIERFKQLRNEFSLFDSNGNVIGFIVKGAEWKPLVNELQQFNQMLYWILPVVKNMKKMCVNTTDDFSDIVQLSIFGMKNIESIIDNYKAENYPNRYVNMIKDMNPYFTPFEQPNPETNSSVIYEKDVKTNINTLIDNLDDFYSHVSEVAKTTPSNSEMPNVSIKTQQFVRQMYNTGLNHLISIENTSSKLVAKVVPLTDPDTLSLRSFVMMPEVLVRFSKINLPNTDILNKSNLNRNFVKFWKIFRPNKTNINTVSINNFEDDIDFEEINFLEGIKNFILELTVEQNELNMTKNEIYIKFLQSIIPKSRFIFNLIKKYIIGKLSILEVVNYMEPFLIYSNDLTYILYTEIVSFLDKKINESNKIFVNRKNIFKSILNKKFDDTRNTSVKAIYNIFGDSKELADNVFGKYQYNPTNNNFNSEGNSNELILTNSELLRKMILKDFGNLYNSAVVFQNLPYMFSDKLNNIFETDKNNLINDKKELENSNKCVTYRIAKHYRKIDDLNQDNNKEIFYDKEYDNTRYSILDDYEKEMLSMNPDDFLKVLINKLQSKMKLSQEEAVELADSLITGYKKVKEGDYAIVYDPDSVKELYFKRDNNVWILDENAVKDFFTQEKDGIAIDPTTLCNIQPDCIDVGKNEFTQNCESFSLNKTELLENSYKKILTEFDKQYELSKDKFKEQIENRFKYFDYIIENINKIELNFFFKYNIQQYKLGIKNGNTDDTEIIVSPYAKLLNIILGEADYVKKQSYIMRFVNKCTREAYKGFGPLNKEEDPHWLYCNKTNVKLIPMSLYQIANFFINDNSNFNRNLDILIKEIGTVSDDGDYRIDKYTGYVIKRIDFDVEEGYDDGFRVRTREVIEEDIGDAFLSNSNIVQKTETPENKMISNLISAFSGSMGINIEHQSEFIKKNVVGTLKSILPTETSYNKEILEASKRGESLPSYKELYNASILYLTIGMILIAIQTSVPSIKTKKTFPGCARSFMGYPIEGVGDETALQYISCIAYKIRTSIEPWNVLLRKKPNFIQSKIKETIDKNLWTLPDVTRKVEEKLDYLLINKDNEIPIEHDIQQWKQFLPPLMPIKIKNLENITPQFKSKLMNSIKNGSTSQRDEILVVDSKIIFFSLSIQEKIQKIIDNKKLLLSTANNVLFMENACCNENNKYNTIDYFNKENGEILHFNNIVGELENILEDIKYVTEPAFMLSRENTKMKYPSLASDIFDEETIYRAFIVYCHFTSLIPIGEDLIALCNNKPEMNLKGLTIEEQINKLKRDNRMYTNESLLRLLQIVNRHNIVSVELDKPQITSIQRLRNLIENFNDKPSEKININTKLLNLIEPTLDTFDIAIVEDTDEMKNLKNYLAKSNDLMKDKVLNFIKKNSNMRQKTLKQVSNMLNNLFIWNNKNDKQYDTKIYDETTYNMINFIKVYIKNLVDVFPNIILNKVNYNKSNIQKYWKLSKNHEKSIQDMIEKYYSRLKKYYNNNINIVLNNIQIKCSNLLLLVNETPYFSSIKYKGRETYSIFDKRTSELLVQQYFLMVLSEYVNISQDETLIFEVSDTREDVIDDVFTIEGLDDKNVKNNIESTTIDQEITFSETRKELKQITSNLLVTYFEIMSDHKDMIDLTYDSIMDSVFKTRENEKNIIIDRLENMTQEMRNLDNTFKMLKMGEIWGKGLEKGLRKYNKKTQEDERKFINRLHEMENKMRKDGVINDRNADLLIQDAAEELIVGDEIENEVYDIADMTEDYMDGQYNPDDIGNTADIDYNEYD